MYSGGNVATLYRNFLPLFPRQRIPFSWSHLKSRTVGQTGSRFNVQEVSEGFIQEWSWTARGL